MSYPFVAAPDNWPRNGVPIKAIAIHMAEGGGTVSWLTRDDGNSSHYVVEYSGRVVQMVREDRAAGSINPKLLREDDDSPFVFDGETVTYGYTAAKKCLGAYWSNPNAAVIAIEVEGFALNGPNDAQRAALKALVADIRHRFAGTPAIGHRDFQSYKRCPGKLIHWQDYGGHGAIGVIPQETDINSIYLPVGGPGRFTIKAGTTARGYQSTDQGWVIVKTLTPTADTGAHYSAALQTKAATPPTSVLLCDSGYFAGLYIPTTDTVDETPDPPPPPPGATALGPGLYEVR